SRRPRARPRFARARGTMGTREARRSRPRVQRGSASPAFDRGRPRRRPYHDWRPQDRRSVHRPHCRRPETAAGAAKEEADMSVGATALGTPAIDAPARARHPLEDLLARRIAIIDGAMGTTIRTYGMTEAHIRGERFRDATKDLLNNGDLFSLTQPAMI